MLSFNPLLLLNEYWVPMYFWLFIETGDNECGKTTLIAKLQGMEDPKKGAGLEYYYIDVRDEYRDGNGLFWVFFLVILCQIHACLLVPVYAYATLSQSKIIWRFIMKNFNHCFHFYNNIVYL